MIARRELIFGAGCAAALGTAEWLRPRHVVTLLPAGTALGTLIPSQFGDWAIGPDGDIVTPPTPGSLADQLYNDRVTRGYRDKNTQQDVMLLAAYGGVQSDVLQLHRPEVCYPAVGFQITLRRLAMIALPGGASIPVVMLTATSGGRVEDVVYWTRLGNDMPQTAGDQRKARLRIAMDGIIADGILVRASAVRYDDTPRFPMLTAFLQEMIASAPPTGRTVLLGTDRARQFV